MPTLVDDDVALFGDLVEDVGDVLCKGVHLSFYTVCLWKAQSYHFQQFGMGFENLSSWVAWLEFCNLFSDV